MLVGAGARTSAGASDVLGGRAVGGHRQEADHRVADRDAVDAFAERVDRAGDVDAGRVRQRHRERALQVAAADAVVDRVERRRGDADPHLAGAGDGLLDVLVAQDARVAELVETDCLHPATPSCVASFCGGRISKP